MCLACSLLARCLLHLSSRRRRSVGAQSGKRALWWRSFTKSIALRRAALSKEVERIDRFKVSRSSSPSAKARQGDPRGRRGFLRRRTTPVQGPAARARQGTSARANHRLAAPRAGRAPGSWKSEVILEPSEILDARSGPMEVADDVPLQREKVSTMTAAPV
jgi:hypothetical protein